MNTKFYKTTIDLCCFLPVFFFFLFKSCFKKDKKCTDTLIRHKQIFCTNHISSDCLKKIAIRILTIKSVRGYLFLEIFYKRPILEKFLLLSDRQGDTATALASRSLHDSCHCPDCAGSLAGPAGCCPSGNRSRLLQQKLNLCNVS